MFRLQYSQVPLTKEEINKLKRELNHQRQVEREETPAAINHIGSIYNTSEKRSAKQDIKSKSLMEVEVKIRLLSRNDYDKVIEIFKDGYLEKQKQDNYFFDGNKQELSSNLTIMRIRTINDNEKAYLTIKTKAVLKDGIGRSGEFEEALNVDLAMKFINNPNEILNYNSKIISDIKEKCNVNGLKSLGGFCNYRSIHKWKGYKLEIDETKYDFGTNYEIECETNEPEKVRDLLEDILKENNINFKYKTITKFACFIKKSLE